MLCSEGRERWRGMGLANWDLERLNGGRSGGDAGSFSVLGCDWLGWVGESYGIDFHKNLSLTSV